MYIPCQIIKKILNQFVSPDNNKQKYLVFVEITKPRVIDYLTGLIDDIEDDLITYNNNNNNKNYKYIFTHKIVNSTTFPNINKNSKFNIQTGGLVIKCYFTLEEYNKYNIGDNVYILFKIDIFNMVHNMNHNESRCGCNFTPLSIMQKHDLV